MSDQFTYTIKTRLGNGTLARTGTIHTPHGDIQTPAFVVVGTKATVKAMTPEQVSDVYAQAVLANAYHLYLQPGHGLVEEAGGLGKFMNWSGPTFTDSGGFQVLSLGSGYKKTIDMTGDQPDTPKRERKAFVSEEGVTFRSHLDGSTHKFTAELSMQIQHALGADIMFAFDELTSLIDPYTYQLESLERTHAWAARCLQELARLRTEKPERPYQALFGVIQGAQYEDLRRRTSKHLASLEVDGVHFDGYGIGGAIEKAKLGDIVRWVNEELPEDKPKHLLGISEPDDIFAAIEQGIDTFDCVSPTRVARNGAAYSYDGRFNIVASRFRRDFTPVLQDCECYTCQNYTRAYLHHLFHAKELLANTLLSIHNEHFIIKLVDDIRASIEDGSFQELKASWLKRYYAKKHD